MASKRIVSAPVQQQRDAEAKRKIAEAVGATMELHSLFGADVAIVVRDEPNGQVAVMFETTDTRAVRLFREMINEVDDSGVVRWVE